MRVLSPRDLLQNKALKLSLGILYFSKVPLHPFILSFEFTIDLGHDQSEIKVQFHHFSSQQPDHNYPC